MSRLGAKYLLSTCVAIAACASLLAASAIAVRAPTTSGGDLLP